MSNLSQLELSHKQIVIVDDDIPSVRYYETILKYTGAEILVFKNGREFIEFIESGKSVPDFVIMDFLIPLINGTDCTKRFRRTNKTTPVIMITAYYSEQIKNEAFIAGCNEYVLKPLFPEKLVMLLERYLSEKLSVKM
jgi:CheY-like chemotaxis protein